MSNLQEFHHFEDTKTERKSHMMVGIIIALVMGGLALYIYESAWNPTTHTVVSDSQLPQH